jgi:hypothetical protein
MTRSTSSNPFATRHFAPGQIPFFFPAPHSLDSLSNQLMSQKAFRWAIIGPHGSGKSTLIAHLLSNPNLRNAFPANTLLRLDSSTSKLPRWWFWMQRTRASLASAQKCKLLITTHQKHASFNTLWETSIDSQIEQHVLSMILQSENATKFDELLQSDAWRSSRNRHGYNLRESLFDMYDWWRDTVDAQNNGR